MREANQVVVVEETLRERARQLAQLPAQIADGAEDLVLVFRLRDERYAIAVSHLRSVQHAQGLTPVPCTPPFVAGMVNVHGDVVSVLDLAVALGLPGATSPDAGTSVLLAECAHGCVGLLADEVLGIERLALNRLDRSLSGRDFVGGVAGANTTLLNLEQLLADGRFDVLDDVE
jgi:purine-binding chemotaxis protein CheW